MSLLLGGVAGRIGQPEMVNNIAFPIALGLGTAAEATLAFGRILVSVGRHERTKKLYSQQREDLVIDTLMSKAIIRQGPPRDPSLN